VAILVVLQVITLILICHQKPHDRIYVSIPAASISVVATCALFLLSHIEHIKSNRPSFLIAIYLCITVVFRCAIARTYWLLDPHDSVPSTTLTVIAVQLVLIALESCSKKEGPTPGVRNASDEQSAGFLSRSLFIWLDPLFLIGYRRTLTASDLEPIDGVLGSSQLADEFKDLQKYPTSAFDDRSFYQSSSIADTILQLEGLGF
jgi:ATP-binding cassette subfamily C (CFTR/MRP) protein 1